eukprot:TRINITY_DN6209_c0_g1_i1.p1 TRINITY_DN6209_c0_g1~~TRINITY_DN6209_c0_g1_i1.p1  ORF type:complete len:474 (+),score=97.78 TRINITY_DN6209_c0_g1_i1:22-1422(+)
MFLQRWGLRLHAASIRAQSSVAPTSQSPAAVYAEACQSGRFREDRSQAATVALLDALHKNIRNYENPANVDVDGGHGDANAGKGGFGSLFSSLFGAAKKKAADSTSVPQEQTDTFPGPQGLYMYGGVGCGKTMLMDMFYRTAPTTKKKRVHFHSFMLDVHRRIHLRKTKFPKEDPIPPLAADLMSEAWLLCFDEFQVTDIADAMVLRRLFRYLWKRGCVLVATSNRPPDDLYHNGIQRESFLPFIGLLKQRCRIHNMDSGKDYRLTGHLADKLYHTPLGPATTAQLHDIFQELTGSRVSEVAPKQIKVMMGRKMVVEKSARGVALFHFDALCRTALGAADYLAICRNFHTVILDGVPLMDLSHRNEARRFITMLDEFYQHHVKLIVGADGIATELFVADPESRKKPAAESHAHSSPHHPAVTHAVRSGPHDEVFAFARAASRLREMQTLEYLQTQATSNPDEGETP